MVVARFDFICKRFIYPIRKVLFLDESGHEPQLRAVHADGATAKEAKMGGEARPSGSGVGLMHRLLLFHVGQKMTKGCETLRSFPPAKIGGAGTEILWSESAYIGYSH